jgi:hypothetical protein
MQKERAFRAAYGQLRLEAGMSKFSTFLLGYTLFVIGVAIAAYLLGAPPLWIGVGALILVGIGIASGANRTKRDDPTPTQ